MNSTTFQGIYKLYKWKFMNCLVKKEKRKMHKKNYYYYYYLFIFQNSPFPLRWHNITLQWIRALHFKMTILEMHAALECMLHDIL